MRKRRIRRARQRGTNHREHGEDADGWREDREKERRSERKEELAGDRRGRRGME
jgi:hypothetical protein